MQKKKYERPSVRKVRLNIKGSVLADCQMSPENVIFPSCETQEPACPAAPAL